MLTIFAVPKSFRGHIGVIQTNAIRSWALLRPACQVILFGDEEGTAGIASELGIQHIPGIECNEYGTPLLSSAFSLAQNVAKYQLVCLVNTDIILMSDFMSAVQRIPEYPFLMVGLRWNLELNELVNFDDAQWESRLLTRTAEHGKLHPRSGCGDYFAFPRGLYRDIPPFAIGRTGWDNWLVYRARSLKVPVIDATEVITAIHQNHDYSHHPMGKEGVWEGPEKDRNIELMGGTDYAFRMNHATLLLTPKGLRPARTLRHLYFRMRAIPVLYPRLHFLLTLFKVLEKPGAALRSIWTRLGR